jgi:hypothetical protein
MQSARLVAIAFLLLLALTILIVGEPALAGPLVPPIGPP